MPFEVKIEGGTLTQGYPGDAGWDLAVSEDVEIPASAGVAGTPPVQNLPTGVHLGLPDNLFARLVGRSSTISKWGLLVVEGIIDAGYTGELFVRVVNVTDQPVSIPSGTRVAQVLFHPIESVKLIEGPIPTTVRGSRGFGSSGV